MNPSPVRFGSRIWELLPRRVPIVIVSRHDPDRPRSLILYVPLTTQRRESPYEVPLPRLPFLDRESVGQCSRIGIGAKPRILGPAADEDGVGRGVLLTPKRPARGPACGAGAPPHDAGDAKLV